MFCRDMTTTSTKGITVAVDLDGVIYDVISHIVDTKLPECKAGLRPSKWSCWEEMGITKEKFFSYYSECWEEAGSNLLTAIKYTDPYAKELFSTLHKEGYRINIITKRANKDIINTVKYLQKMKFHFDCFTVIHDEHDKLKENFDIIIEDNPVNLPQNHRQGGILVNQNWNKDYELKYLQVRIYHLKDAFLIVDTMRQMRPRLLELSSSFQAHQ